MITDHVFRHMTWGGRQPGRTEAPPTCQYLNCGRPAQEHERSYRPRASRRRREVRP